MTAAATRVYRPARRLARGGMGQVEIVVRSEGSFRRVYALKRLHAQYADDPDVRAMFMDEARIAGLIRHPNVVGVLDVGEDGEGPFLVMEYVEGVSISQLLRALGGRLPLPIVLDVVRQAADGLHAAHELCSPDGVPLEVVHRDISPQNILVGFDGLTRVTDFGIARALDRLTQTAEGCLKGKLGYMSPEQLRFHPVDRRSDLFSLGVVLHEMLGGHRLYGGERAAAFRRILEEPPPPPSASRAGVPPALDALVISLLAKEPSARPQTARAVADSLQEVIAGLDPTSLRTFMESALPDLREEQRTIVAGALTTSPSATPAPLAVAAPAASQARALGRTWIVALAVLLLGGAALGAALLSRASGETEEPTTQAAAPIETAREPAPVADVAVASEPEPLPTPEAPPPAPAPSEVRDRSHRGAKMREVASPQPRDTTAETAPVERGPRLGWGWDDR